MFQNPIAALLAQRMMAAGGPRTSYPMLPMGGPHNPGILFAPPMIHGGGIHAMHPALPRGPMASAPAPSGMPPVMPQATTPSPMATPFGMLKNPPPAFGMGRFLLSRPAKY